ncbi:MAG: hypothetical protein ACLFO2_00645 [Candidatus Woesearchaeota archaeon]
MEGLEEALASIREDLEFRHAYNVARQNSLKAYLVGDFLVRNIAHVLYGTSRPEHDVDLLVEGMDENLKLPPGWKEGQNRFGNPKIISATTVADIIPLENVDFIKRKGLEPSLDAYLTGVPLTIQSLAYDVENDELRGNVGLKALKERKVAVNNHYFADLTARKYGRFIEDYVQEQAQRLGFTPFFSPWYS